MRCLIVGKIQKLTSKLGRYSRRNKWNNRLDRKLHDLSGFMIQYHQRCKAVKRGVRKSTRERK